MPFSGRWKLTKPQVEKAAELFGLSKSEKVMLNETPMRGTPMPPTDPLIYRFYEMIMINGPAIKALIEEEFGDGFMSAIDFDMSIERQANPKGDRVKIGMTGKFLPYRYYGASGNVRRNTASAKSSPRKCRLNRPSSQAGRQLGLAVQPNEPLAEIVAAVQSGNGFRTVLDAVADIFAVSDLSRTHPRLKPRDRLFIAMHIVEGDEAAHARALDQTRARRVVPAGGRVPQWTDAVPQITMRAPTASCR